MAGLRLLLAFGIIFSSLPIATLALLAFVNDAEDHGKQESAMSFSSLAIFFGIFGAGAFLGSWVLSTEKASSPNANPSSDKGKVN
jgi:hypothetical protein